MGDLHFVEVRTHLAATATHRQSLHAERLVGITDTPGHAIGIAKTVGIAARTVVVTDGIPDEVGLTSGIIARCARRAWLRPTSVLAPGASRNANLESIDLDAASTEA